MEYAGIHAERKGETMRLGIITHYYNSKNYGGMLQAYALVKVLRDLGYDAEQICYLAESNSTQKSLKSCVKSLINMVIKKKLDRRKKAFKQFEISIPHSKKVYSERDIEQSVELYDSFITGSDQVWNFKWYISSYFLTFVPSRKKKIAYAASMGTSSLSEEESIKLKEHIKDYTAVSLRESDSADFVQTLTRLPVQTTLDPTLLLDLDDWKSISNDRLIKGQYLFCYFLGRDKTIRVLAKRFAKKHNLKIVTLPNLQQHLEINDLGFGQHRLYDVNPGGFVSLIRNADYIFTDSFHATVISLIFHKSFISFGRNGSQAMNNRIDNLLNIFDCHERFLSAPENVEISDIDSITNKELVIDTSVLEKRRKESIAFLKSSLNNNDREK